MAVVHPTQYTSPYGNGPWTIVITNDEYFHTHSNILSSTRTGKVAKKGQSFSAHAFANGMYQTDYGWVSGAYIKIENAQNSSRASSSSGSTSSGGGLMGGGIDYLVGVGGAFLFLILVGDLIKKI